MPSPAQSHQQNSSAKAGEARPQVAVPPRPEGDGVEKFIQMVKEGAKPNGHGQRGGFSQGGSPAGDPFEVEDPRHFRK